MASHPKTSLFDGTFCRKPNQNFGGRRTNDDRETLLKKAKLDREKREREKLVSQSIVVVQAGVRSYLTRRALRISCREEYDKNKKPDYTPDEFGRQLRLFVRFYSPDEDSIRLQEMAGLLLKNKDFVMDKCFSNDFVWISRIRYFLRYCVAALRNAWIVPASTSTRYLRLIEIFTEYRDRVKVTEEEIAQPSYFTIIIWLELTGIGRFFKFWREILESRQPGTYVSTTAAYLDILNRPIQLLPRLKNYPDKIPFADALCDADSACRFIMTQFVEGICIRKAMPEDSEGSSQVVASEIIPKILRGFPLNQFLQYASTERLLGRSMFYVILRLCEGAQDVDSLLLGNVVWKYLKTIDKTLAPLDSYRTDYLYQLHISSATRQDLDDLEEDYAHDDPTLIQYLKEVHTLYHMLPDILEHQIKLISLINPTDLSNWSLYCHTVCHLVTIDERTSERIPYLATLAFRKDILRSAYLTAMNYYENPDAWWVPRLNALLVGFCYGFNHLLDGLHDDEFIGAIPMSLDELDKLIRTLVTMYENIALKDSQYDAETNTLKYIILWTLRSLYDRNTRVQHVPEETFRSQYAQIYLPLEAHNFDFDSFNEYGAAPFRRAAFLLTDPQSIDTHESKLIQVLNEAPFMLSFDSRVNVWRRLLDNDRVNRDLPINPRDHIQIRRSLLYEDAYEKLSLENVPDLRANVRISLVNVVGAPEAGVDGGGLLREFLIEATKAGVDPNRGFFRLDSQNRIYPNPVARGMDSNYLKHFFLMGRLVGKSLYEGILLELPFAAFFIQACISGYVPSAVDYLATLDPALHRNLLQLKNYRGDWNAIGLDFTVTNDEFGQVRSIELKKNGGDILVNQSNVIEYIHLVAEYKINREMEDECRAFRSGILGVVPILRMFSWREMKTLISGSDKPINVQDWKENINYSGGYTADHPSIVLFWEVVGSFQEEYLRKLLKFVTSCSRPPLLGFKYLIPNFGIQSTGETDRLPTAATCMNLLKLPQYTDPNVMRQKLMYVVDAQAGFELS